MQPRGHTKSGPRSGMLTPGPSPTTVKPAPQAPLDLTRKRLFGSDDCEIFSTDKSTKEIMGLHLTPHGSPRRPKAKRMTEQALPLLSAEAVLEAIAADGPKNPGTQYPSPVFFTTRLCLKLLFARRRLFASPAHPLSVARHARRWRCGLRKSQCARWIFDNLKHVPRV